MPRHTEVAPGAVEVVDPDVAVRTPRRLAPGGGVIGDMEDAARGVVGSERHREEPLLELVLHVRNYQERVSQSHVVADQVDLPALLDDEDPARVVRRRGHVGRLRSRRAWSG
jgi:hypothetical protein